jgi:hypothetical protein
LAPSGTKNDIYRFIIQFSGLSPIVSFSRIQRFDPTSTILVAPDPAIDGAIADSRTAGMGNYPFSLALFHKQPPFLTSCQLRGSDKVANDPKPENGDGLILVFRHANLLCLVFFLA